MLKHRQIKNPSLLETFTGFQASMDRMPLIFLIYFNDSFSMEYVSFIRAPRYLLKHLLQTHPEKYYLYNQMKSSLPAKESDPFPHTQELLPLRPKSCCPRIRTGPGVVEVSFQDQIQINQMYIENNCIVIKHFHFVFMI